MTAARPSTGVACMVGATALWGATFVVIRDSLSRIDPVALVWNRFAVATLLLVVALIVRRRRPDTEAWRGGVLGGLFAAGGFLFQAIGLQTTTAGTSAFLTSTGSLLAGLYAWPILGQKPSAALVSGIALATVGSALLAGPASLRIGAGETWTLAGALCWGAWVVAQAKFAPHADPLALTAVQAATITVALLPWAFGHPLIEPWREPATAARLLYLVVAGSVIAPLLQVVALRTLSAGRVGLLLALEPVFALGFAIAFGGERFAIRWWLGAALILAGVTWVEWRSLRAKPSPTLESSR
jgi:drug/metabolite transporter (DMT)-like permease